jgi:hypothetical protein
MMATWVSTIKQRMCGWTEVWSLLTFVIPFIIYIASVCPIVAILDSAELTTAAVSLGITRATGYPLYILLGFLWSRLPLGNYGLRMNLFSALNGALTLMLVYLVMRRLKIPNWAAAVALGLLAFSPYFWGLSVVAEVYTLHTTLLVGTILVMFVWADRPTFLNTLFLFGMVGLSLSNHMSSLLTLPGLGIYLLYRNWRRVFKPQIILAGVLGLILGLTPYLYIPIRYAARPAFNYAGIFDQEGLFYPVNLGRIEGLWWLASGKVFSTRVFDNFDVIDQTMGIFIRALGRTFFGLGIGPGIYGMIKLFKKHSAEAIFFMITFIINVIFFTTYRVIDLETMFLPAYVIFAIWIGFGFRALMDLLGETDLKPFFKIGQWPVDAGLVFKGLLILFVVFVTVWNWPLISQSGNYQAQEKAEAIFAQVEEGAIIYGKWPTIPVLQYYQIVEGRRPDLKLINRFLISPTNMEYWIGQEVALQQRPIYIDYITQYLIDHYSIGDPEPLYPIS